MNKKLDFAAKHLAKDKKKLFQTRDSLHGRSLDYPTRKNGFDDNEQGKEVFEIVHDNSIEIQVSMAELWIFDEKIL